MASEHALWENLRKRLRSEGADAMRVENAVCAGTPDVNGCSDSVEFWVELKWVAAWPKMDRSSVNIGLRLEQARWLHRRGKVGGRCWILVQVGTDYLLHWWIDAKDLYEHKLTQAQMRSRATAVWEGRMPARELVTILRGI